MSALLAAARADELNLPLFVHVLGAMTLVGGLFAGQARWPSPEETDAGSDSGTGGCSRSRFRAGS